MRDRLVTAWEWGLLVTFWVVAVASGALLAFVAVSYAKLLVDFLLAEAWHL